MSSARSVRQDWRRGVCPGAKKFHAAYPALVVSAAITKVVRYRVSSGAQRLPDAAARAAASSRQ
jgi:hypothetical protein